MMENKTGEYATARAASAAGTIMVCYYVNILSKLIGVWSFLIQKTCILMSLV